MSYVILLDTMGNGLKMTDSYVYSENELKYGIENTIENLIDEGEIECSRKIPKSEFQFIQDKIVICEIVDKTEMINNILNEYEDPEYKTYLKLKEKFEND